MPGSVGSVSVSVVPSAEGWNDKLKAQVMPGADELGEEIGAAIRAGIDEALEGVGVSVRVDDGQALAAMTELAAAKDELTRQDATITMRADPDEALGAIGMIEAQLDDLARDAARLDIGVTDEAALARIEQVREAIDGLEDFREIDLNVNAQDADEKLADMSRYVAGLRARVDELAASQAAASAAISETGDAAAASVPELAAAAVAARDLADAQLDTGGSATSLAGTLRTVRSELGDAELGDSITVIKTGLGEFSVAAKDAGAAGEDAVPGIEDLLTALRGLRNESGAGGGGEGGAGLGGQAGLIAGALLAVGPAAVGAGVAVGAFAGLAIPEIKAIADGTGQFKDQLAGLKTEYMGLSDSVKPEVLSDFDIALDQAKAILPEFSGAAKSGGSALGDLETQLGHFAQSSESKDFLAFVGQSAPADLHAIGNAAQGAGNAIAGLTESLSGMSRGVLDAAGGLLSVTGNVLRLDPAVGDAAVGLTALQLASSKFTDKSLLQWSTSSGEGLKGLKSAFSDASKEGGLFEGVMGAVTEISPVGWALAGAAAFTALAGAVAESKIGTLDYEQELAAADHASGENVEGYQKLSRQLADTAGSQDKVNVAMGQQAGAVFAAYSGTNLYAGAAQKMQEQSRQAAEHAQQLAAQVSQLAVQFGIADPAADQLAGILHTIDTSAAGSKASIAAYGEEIALTGGNALSTWSAQTQLQAGLLAVEQAAKATGATMNGTNAASVQLREAFQSQAGGLDAYAEAQAKAGTMTHATASYLADQTAQLAGLAGGSQQAQAQIEDEIEREISWGASTATVNKAVDALASDMDGAFIGSLSSAAQHSTAVKSATDALTTSILKTGTTSVSTESDRAALIKDLENAGVSAQTAAKLVQELVDQIAALHDKTINITVQEKVDAAEGGATIPGITTGGRRITGAASGAYIATGTPGVDDQLILAQRGELVVPTHIVSSGAVDHLRGAIPGFASGGIVGASASGGDALDFQVVMNILNDAGDYDTSKAGVDDADKLAQEFSDGTLKTVTEIRDAGTEAITALKDYYTGPHQAELVSAMNKQVTALDQLAAKSSTIATEIANMKTYAANETSSLSGFADLSTVTGDTDATTGVTAPVTSSDISSQLAADLATLKQFEAVIKQLQAAKVSTVLINQVIALGPAQGVIYGQAILSAGSAFIKQLNTTESQISSAETTVGQEAADVQYGVSIGTGVGTGFLASLKKQQSAINKEMATYGDAIADELTKALNGKVTIPKVTPAQVAASTTAAASATDVGGTITTSAGGATGPSATQMNRLIQAVDTTDDTIKLLRTDVKTLTSQMLGAFKALPKAEAASIGPAVASALNGVAQKAAQAARTNTR